MLPLRKASDLMQRPIVQFVLAASGSLTGEISRLPNKAAALAILDGTEHITLGHLEHVANPHHWSSPVARCRWHPGRLKPRCSVAGSGVWLLATGCRCTSSQPGMNLIFRSTRGQGSW